MNLFDDILSIIFPQRCHICKGHLGEHEKFICQKCVDTLPYTMYHRILFNPVEQRFAGIIRFERATSLLIYTRNSDAAKIIHDFKYREFPSLATLMGMIMAKELYTSGFFNDIDCIIPVPLHFVKRLKRGYNQSRMLAKGVASVIDCHVATNLYARRHHSTQTAKNRYERWQNTTDTFSVKRPHQLEGKHILLIDDVCTTGATLIAAAQAILKIPNTKISILTLAATPQ